MTDTTETPQDTTDATPEQDATGGAGQSDEPVNPGEPAEPGEPVDPGDGDEAEGPGVAGVLDLRPTAESVQDELLRLDLKYDRVDEATGLEQWRNYGRHLLATFPAVQGDPVTVTDTDTGRTATIDLDRLRRVTRIIVSGETI